MERSKSDRKKGRMGRSIPLVVSGVISVAIFWLLDRELILQRFFDAHWGHFVIAMSIVMIPCAVWALKHSEESWYRQRHVRFDYQALKRVLIICFVSVVSVAIIWYSPGRAKDFRKAFYSIQAGMREEEVRHRIERFIRWEDHYYTGRKVWLDDGSPVDATLTIPGSAAYSGTALETVADVFVIDFLEGRVVNKHICPD